MHKLVLIVEDDPLISSILDTILKQADYRTQLAINGKEAIDLIKQHKPDLITLDINMPEMTGTELLEKMKKTTYMDNVKVILVSGMPADELIDALISGADWVFEKPVDPHLFLNKVNELIG